MEYKIENLSTYPTDGNHKKCITKLPFIITKGNDPFIYYEHESDKNWKEYNSEKEFGNKVDARWIVILSDNANFSLKECFTVKLNKDLNKILKWCERCYILSLELEIKRLKKEYKTYCC